MPPIYVESMRRHGNLFHLITDRDNIALAYKQARRGKPRLPSIARFDVNRVYAILEHEGDAEFEENVLNYALTYTRGWDEAEGRLT